MYKKPKEFRTLVFVGVMTGVLGLIFATPFGFVWGLVIFVALGIIEALTSLQINILLWSLLWYLLTVELFWVIILKKAPQRYQLQTISE